VDLLSEAPGSESGDIYPVNWWLQLFFNRQVSFKLTKRRRTFNPTGGKAMCPRPDPTKPCGDICCRQGSKISQRVNPKSLPQIDKTSKVSREPS